MSTEWIKLIGGGFAHMSAPFAVHPFDKDRAREYRDQARAAGLQWDDVHGHLDAYATEQGWTAEKRTDEAKRVRKFMGM